MADKKAKYTPWNIPQSSWTSMFDDIEIDSNTRQELVDAIREFDSTELDKRLRAYEIQITNETMSRLIK